jgi:hypothetical protein
MARNSFFIISATLLSVYLISDEVDVAVILSKRSPPPQYSMTIKIYYGDS